MSELEPKRPRRPNGMRDVRIDKSGRLTLPADFRRWLEQQGSGDVFVTTLNRKDVHIYAVEVWQGREERMHTDPKLAPVVRRLLLTAHYFGGDTGIDEQGRIVLPPRVREELKLADSTAQVWAHSDRVEILKTSQIAEAMAQTEEAAANDFALITEAGYL